MFTNRNEAPQKDLMFLLAMYECLRRRVMIANETGYWIEFSLVLSQKGGDGEGQGNEPESKAGSDGSLDYDAEKRPQGRPRKHVRLVRLQKSFVRFVFQ